MSEIDEVFFGRIVERSGLATPEQIKECVALQAERKTVPLGQILVERGYLTEAQLEQVLSIQSKNLQQEHPETRKSLAESLFGKLVLLKRFARAGEVHECLRLQQALKEHGQHTFLGELLVMKGRMSAAQVAAVLKDQNRMVLFCESCLERIQIPDYDPEQTYTCEACGKGLREPIPIELADGGEPDAKGPPDPE